MIFDDLSAESADLSLGGISMMVGKVKIRAEIGHITSLA